jgi:hypothetical protein
MPSRFPYLFRQPYRNLKLFKNFALPFPNNDNDAIDDRGSAVTCFLGGDEVLLILFRVANSSISSTALLCSSALHCSLVSERPKPWYRRAVFIGDDLAVRSNPRLPPPHRQGALLAPH